MLKGLFSILLRWLCSVGVALVVLPLPANAQLPTLRMVGDNWCPYNCAPDAPQRGYLVDILNVILGRQYALTYELVPWTRALSMVDSGDAQILIGTPPTDGNKTLSSVSLGLDRTCFFVHRDNPWRYQGLETLNGSRLGVIQDYRYDGNGPLDQLIATYRTRKDTRLEIAVGEDALASNFRKLRARRMDVVVENENVGRFMIQRLKLQDDIVFANCASHRVQTTHIAVSLHRADAAQILAIINTGLAELRRTGELHKILQPYGIADWQVAKESKPVHKAQ
jgi:polar amino acid transport system substrate-binding protein